MSAMKGASRHKKSKKGRIVREMRKREPQVHENTKRLLALNGLASNEVMDSILHDLVHLRKPNAKMFARKNPIVPFEDAASLEFLCERNDCSLFAIGSHSKKRPNNLVLGRMFDFKVLDMIELAVTGYSPISSFKGPKKAPGSKPCMLFNGDEWNHDNKFMQLKSLLLDMFRGQVIDKIALPGLDHVISVTASGDNVYFRVSSITFKRSGTKVPRVELDPMGPNLNFSFRRTKFATPDLYKLSRRVPKEAKVTKVKNVSRDELGSKVGRLHMERQDFDSLQLRKVKALKRVRSSKQRAAKRGRDEDALEDADVGSVAAPRAGAGGPEEVPAVSGPTTGKGGQKRSRKR